MRLIIGIAIHFWTMITIQSAPTDNDWVRIGDRIKKDLLKETEPKDVLMSKDELETSSSCSLIRKKFLVKHPKCVSKEILLPVCYGQCNSLYFPGNSFRDTMGLCQSCQPTTKDYMQITLICPHAKLKKIRKRKIEVFKGCACKKCG